MKAILVIDMPSDCKNCLLNIYGICAGTGELIHSISCPLKPMPKKLQIDVDEWDDGYDNGWNDCIDELVGEKE